MSAVDDLLAVPAASNRPEPKRDRWGRYLLPGPNGEKPTAYTRATTVASTLSDKFGLQAWSNRMVAIGLSRRPDLLNRVAATPIEEKKALDQLAEQAKEMAAASAGANNGTALHAFTEQVDLGQPCTAPPALMPHVDLYRQTLLTQGVHVVPGMVEQIAVLAEHSVAGTFDRIVHLPDHAPMIADLKTGGYLDWTEISVQLAIYAHAETLYDLTAGRHIAMPSVDQNQALVIHLPAAANPPECTLWLVDIDAGWEAFQQSMWVRDWRKRKDLVQRVESASLATPAPVLAAVPDLLAEPALANDQPPSAEVIDWLRSRVQALIAGGAKDQVAAGWPAGVPTIKQGLGSEAHVAAIDMHLSAIEARVLDGFAPPDPRRTRTVQAKIDAGKVDLFGGCDKGHRCCAANQPGGLHDHPMLVDPAVCAKCKDAGLAPTDDPFAGLPGASPLVPSDDPRIVDIIARGKALPSDLLDDLDASTVGTGRVHNLVSGKASEKELTLVLTELERCEVLHEERKGEVLSLLSGFEADQQDTLVAEAHHGDGAWTRSEIENLIALVDAIERCVLAFAFDEHDLPTLAIGEMGVRKLIEAHETKAAALNAGKQMAEVLGRPKPRTFADLLADPLLVAATLTTT
jgi:hypothetical protein